MWFEKVNMESPVSQTTDGGSVNKLKIKKLSMRSQDLYNDIVEFEEKFTSMKVKISVRREEPKEDNQKENDR